MNLEIVPYEDKYDEQIKELEHDAIQGQAIQLEIIKKHFLDRAIVFKKYLALLALDPTGNLIATCIGARTTMIVNGSQFDAGVGFEVKVRPASRNKGVGKSLAKFTRKSFFQPEGLVKNFITLKKSNIPVIRLVAKAIPRMWLYNFVYLTIPTKVRVTHFPMTNFKNQTFSTTLFKKEELSNSYYTTLANNLSYFHSYKMYHLKIRRVSLTYRIGLWMMKQTQPTRYSQLPRVMNQFSFATLFDHHQGNIQNINLALDQLENAGINYLMVCCQKKDSIYSMLKKFSINTYGYYILSDFPLSNRDEVTIDVRCL